MEYADAAPKPVCWLKCTVAGASNGGEGVAGGKPAGSAACQAGSLTVAACSAQLPSNSNLGEARLPLHPHPFPPGPCLRTSHPAFPHGSRTHLPRSTPPHSLPSAPQDMSQLLENVFADPKGFGIGPDGRYRYEHPGFTAGTAEVS